MRQGRKLCSSFLAVDAQSIKNTDSAQGKGYDASKKILGIKQHIAVDTQCLQRTLAITEANITDRNGALLAFAQGVKAILGENVSVQVVRRNELHAFKVIPKRCVVK